MFWANHIIFCTVFPFELTNWCVWKMSHSRILIVLNILGFCAWNWVALWDIRMTLVFLRWRWSYSYSQLDAAVNLSGLWLCLHQSLNNKSLPCTFILAVSLFGDTLCVLFCVCDMCVTHVETWSFDFSGTFLSRFALPIFDFFSAACLGSFSIYMTIVCSKNV